MTSAVCCVDIPLSAIVSLLCVLTILLFLCVNMRLQFASTRNGRIEMLHFLSIYCSFCFSVVECNNRVYSV